MALTSLKLKMQKIKDDIDAAEERAYEAKMTLKEVEQREEQNLSEAASMRNRIQLLGNELRKTDERLAEVEEKLYTERGKTQTHEEIRRGLEDNEMEGDEKIQDWEQLLRDKKSVLKENTDRLTEGQRREIVLKIDLEKALQKGDDLEDRIKNLTNTLEEGAEQVKILEETEEEKFEREEENEEKVKFLEEQVKQCDQRCDIAEREIQKLNRLSDQIQLEIAHYVELKQEQQAEMAALANLDCFDD